ncbi:hypothetical protein [Streptomyces albipurpureus]|uniref:Uncharacterized protein n=1 Tax=Streptomyces albipurpureus TaxID=2897419 RepID=A0ABT0UIG9_9ACTN|nr:hypothetical protein [Streptomyces sp. CWNU-1]MCM2388022.1 hypothetical protein [Streptomyces sp. CWNU-1]
MNATPTGALLLCRADASATRAPAQLLREQLLLAPAGEGWSVLVPEGRPWRDSGESVERVLAGWASAVAIGTSGPVVALWWDGERAGFTLASGFRRQVGYVWLADGTAVGEDEAMRTFAARLGLDPVLDVQSLEPLTRPDPEADARSRLLGLIALLSRAGLELPPGLAPGESAGRLRATAHAHGAQTVEWAGWRDAVRAEIQAVEEGLDHWLRAPRQRTRAQVIGAVQLGAGVPLAIWGLRRHSAGWFTAGTVLIINGVIDLAVDRARIPGS